MKKLCCGTYFTEKWCYSIESWLEHFCSAVSGFSGVLVISTDTSELCKEKARNISEKLIPFGWTCRHVATDVGSDDQKAYDLSAQKIIARIQNKAFSIGREIGADYFWSIESDILVPPNSLKVLIQSLEFDDGYYGVGMVTYCNGQFLGGRGTATNNISEDAVESEREIPKELQERHKKLKDKFAKFHEAKKKPTEAVIQEARQIEKEIKACSPLGNVFALNSKKWRKRGWMDSAYPAIGRGAIVPTDWVGLGCTLMNKKALSLATFDGYELKGTQDLFLCWHRWHPNDIKMCVIPHIVCAHVKRRVSKDGKRTEEIYVSSGSHELEGECIGHLRQRESEYHNLW